MSTPTNNLPPLTVNVASQDIVTFNGRHYLGLASNETGVAVTRHRTTGAICAWSWSELYANGWYADHEHGTSELLALVTWRRDPEDGDTWLVDGEWLIDAIAEAMDDEANDTSDDGSGWAWRAFEDYVKEDGRDYDAEVDLALAQDEGADQ